ncbi:MAG: hypothetical protein ACSHX0_01720 [Akkermansiaceae bacterium]
MTVHPSNTSTLRTTLWPLLQDSSIGEQLIAGRKLSDLQQINCQGVESAHQQENAWITSEDWIALRNAPSPAILKSVRGDSLAWIGDEVENALVVIASDLSFLIAYPWEFIAINEQVVAALKEDVIEGEVSPAAHIEGVIHLGKGSRILPGVFIEGNVVIGENCKIGPNCYLRGSSTIGDGCHIGQAVEIKNSIVGHGSAIGHLSYVGDSVIGEQANFGAGTITSNLRHDGSNHRSVVAGTLTDTGRRKFGCIIGNGVHTGIHTAIYPGRKLGPGTSTLPAGIVQEDIF